MLFQNQDDIFDVFMELCMMDGTHTYILTWGLSVLSSILWSMHIKFGEEFDYATRRLAVWVLGGVID